MKSTFRVIANATSLALLLLASIAAHAQYTYTYTYFPNNTTIDYDASSTDSVIVGYSGGGYNESTGVPEFTGPSSPTINIVDAATVYPSFETDVFNASTVNVKGGSVGFLISFDTSHLNVIGGSTDDIVTFDHSVLTMAGGYVGEIDLQGMAGTVSGGRVDALYSNGASDFYGRPIGNSVLDLTGGSVGFADADNDGAILNVRGGSIDQDLLAVLGGTINIYGKGLQALLVNPLANSGRYSQYALSGTLSDGSALNALPLYIANDNGHSTFSLISNASAPEPASLALCGLPLAALFVRRFRSRRNRLS